MHTISGGGISISRAKDKDDSLPFAGIYQDKLCFLFSEWRDDNLKYKLAFYFIDGGVLKPLCDEKGNPYYINYSFLDKYEQQMVTEEKYLP